MPGAVDASEQVSLAWEPSAGADNYSILYGTAPGQYWGRIDIGNRIQYEMPLLPDGIYYFAVQARSGDDASPPSKELKVEIVSPAVKRQRSRADFNGDGQYDLLWRDKVSGYLAAWMLNGTAVKVEVGISHSMPDVNWEVGGTGDFNADGKADIVWRNKQNGAVGVWFMDRTQVLGAVSFSLAQVETTWKIAGVGDFNEDGHADILWQHDTGPLALWTMRRTTLRLVSPVGLGLDMPNSVKWRVASIADIDGDGHVDILWRHNEGWLGAWLMRGTEVTGISALDPLAEFDPEWQLVGAADINVDGKQDILWQHSTDGSVVVWYMDGTTRTGTATIAGGSLGGSNWKVVGPK
jgi:hypothetical protein